MNVHAPKFVESPYFVPEFGNWHLKEGAPKDVVHEFNQFMKKQRKEEKEGRES